MKAKNNNANFGLQMAGNFPVATNLSVVALFDPQNGQIHHFHQTVTFEGAEIPGQTQHEEEALSLAKRLGCEVTGLKALHLKDFVPEAKIYRVDLKSKKLVAEDVLKKRL